MVLFVVYAFSGAIYIQATGTSNQVNNASIAFVDEDESALSKELMNAFYSISRRPRQSAPGAVENAMDEGRFMFVVEIPYPSKTTPHRQPDIQLNIDATAMQRRASANYIKNIINDRITTFSPHRPVGKRSDKPHREQVVQSERRVLVVSGVVAIINQVTMLAIILTGAAVIREREHGTLEHLLVMPLTPSRSPWQRSGRTAW